MKIAFVHSPCADGIGAALMFHVANMHDHINIVPIDYPYLTADYVKEVLSLYEEGPHVKEIAFLDICPPFNEVVKISEHFKNSDRLNGTRILIIDHHKGALDTWFDGDAEKAALIDNFTMYFEDDHCGTQNTFDFYYNRGLYTIYEKELREIAAHHDARDMWIQYPKISLEAKEASENWIANLMQEFSEVVTLKQVDADLRTKIRLHTAFVSMCYVAFVVDKSNRKQAYVRGETIRNVRKVMAAKFAMNPVFSRDMPSHNSDEKFAVVNCPYEFSSDVCHNVLQRWPNLHYTIGISFIGEKDGKVVWQLSFRSDNKKDFDVSKVAQRFGGGGHKHASGAKVLTYASSIHDLLGELKL